MSVLEMKYALPRMKCLLHSWSTNVAALNLPLAYRPFHTVSLPGWLSHVATLWLTLTHSLSPTCSYAFSLSDSPACTLPFFFTNRVIKKEEKNAVVVTLVWCQGWGCFFFGIIGIHSRLLILIKSKKQVLIDLLHTLCLCVKSCKWPCLHTVTLLSLSFYNFVFFRTPQWCYSDCQITNKFFLYSPLWVQSARVHWARLCGGSDPGHGCRHRRERRDGLQDHRERRPRHVWHRHQ